MPPRDNPGYGLDRPGSSCSRAQLGQSRPQRPPASSGAEARSPLAGGTARPRARGRHGCARLGGLRVDARRGSALRPGRADGSERRVAAVGRSALRPVEVRIRPERARGRVSGPFLCPYAPGPVRCRRSCRGVEAPLGPGRSSRRSGAGRSRPAAALPAARPGAHALADLTGPALGLGRAWPGRVADGAGDRAGAGSALAPPAAAGRHCPGAGYRHRVPAGPGRADRRLLALRRCHRAPGGIPLRRGLRRRAGLLLRAAAGNVYRPHQPARGPLLHRCCCQQHGAGTRREPGGLVAVGGVRSLAGPILAARSVVNRKRVHGRAHPQGEKHRRPIRPQTAGNTGGGRPSPLRQPLRSRYAPAVLRPRPGRNVPHRAQRGSEPGGHHPRAGFSSWQRESSSSTAAAFKATGTTCGSRRERPAGRSRKVARRQRGRPASGPSSSPSACYSCRPGCSEPRFRSACAPSWFARPSPPARLASPFWPFGHCSPDSGRELDHRGRPRWRISLSSRQLSPARCRPRRPPRRSRSSPRRCSPRARAPSVPR